MLALQPMVGRPQGSITETTSPCGQAVEFIFGTSKNEHMETSCKLHVTGKSTGHRGDFSNICPTPTKLNSSTLTNGKMQCCLEVNTA